MANRPRFPNGRSLKHSSSPISASSRSWSSGPAPPSGSPCPNVSLSPESMEPSWIILEDDTSAVDRWTRRPLPNRPPGYGNQAERHAPAYAHVRAVPEVDGDYEPRGTRHLSDVPPPSGVSR